MLRNQDYTGLIRYTYILDETREADDYIGSFDSGKLILLLPAGLVRHPADLPENAGRLLILSAKWKEIVEKSKL